MSDRTLNHPISSHTEAQDDSDASGFPSKRLIVCCDGTWNSGDVAGQTLTNVAKIARCISDVDKHDGRNFVQIVHYEPGIGTGTRRNANIRDGMFGKGIGIGKTIRSAYTFICLNWSNQKDEIVLIGFSRGAFAARCIAQFINDVGLLTKNWLRHLLNSSPELWGWKELQDDIKIEACAVWDTVCAVGVAGFPWAKYLPRNRVPHQRYRTVGTTVPKNIKLNIQVRALGEQRVLYRPLVWDNPDSSQVLNQYWFAGDHSNVGGGHEDMTHANITLAWMISQLKDKWFNKVNIWVITTTRSWSKPSPDDDLTSEPSPNKRSCKVVAKVPIPLDLVPSQNSWLVYFMRIFGLQPRMYKIPFHYSVYILRSLGVTKYERLSISSRDENGASKDEASDLSKQSKFEAEILDRWAKHIACAHINLWQARNSAEAIEVGELRYRQRIQGNLLSNASYKADIPVYAILSIFYTLAKDNKPLFDNIYEALRTKNRSPRRWIQFWRTISQFRQEPAATFHFDCLDSATASSQSSSGDLDLTIDKENESQNTVLIFTRTFHLLMGRAHETLGPKTNASWTETFGRYIPWPVKRNTVKLPPCDRCSLIWELESENL
ncbi:hypothetical protein BP6252_11973 [Coleophoma cylindrospora]|uniref:T6SS Phospholipase effector Tle1-like catalytic domain-containing protein n=1 Tax=Coleophoma cylindrospora TaxID=1849047 RepID=A0A3D8QFZ0_9HELO|nr:hypothetical protein BP6252_11973 [Coleophoma cylindrospora]